MKSVLEFQKKREAGEKISMVTCYDSTSARIVQSSAVDCILVGDSLAMTMHGHRDTVAATPELMALHVAAVRRGAPDKFLVGDMPFLAHRGSRDRALDAVAAIMAAGAQAVKIEGIDGSEEIVSHIVEGGVPVMAHLGLTPQSVHLFGGFKVQGTGDGAAEWLLGQARRAEKAGCFAIVLECVPAAIASLVTAGLRVPTIGIGAGAGCSGQVLVFQDLLGLNTEFQPRFARRFLSGAELFREALDAYHAAVGSGEFPLAKESY
jgi:3-methyl-2-oxobutanoate hydroxymethyltransferase